MTGEPKVSVLMTVHNGAAFLRPAIDSVLAQSFGDFEFVIVDDGSADESVRIVRSYGDRRIRLYACERNLGQTTALNAGLRLCRGAYVARMDADDLCRPDRLARQVRALDADSSIGIVGSAVRIVDGRGRPLDFAVSPLADSTIRFVSLTRNPFHHPAVAIRRRVLTENGLEFDERFQANQDFELWTRLLPLTRAANLPQALLDYRVHGANISVLRLAEQQRTSVDFCRKRQRDEGVERPLEPEILRGIFDAIHGSHLVGEERLRDASDAADAFLDLAAAHAKDAAARRWAAGLVVRAALLGRIRRRRSGIFARAHRLAPSAAFEAVRANAPVLYYRALRAIGRRPAAGIGGS